MKELLDDKTKELKEKETEEINQLKNEHDTKINLFKEKYRILEENEFNYLEKEFNKNKEKMELDFKTKLINLENNYSINQDRLRKQVNICFVI
jgi:hypothetical protein